MTDIDITIGWTRSEVVDGHLVYSSFGEGYRPGASQHTEDIALRFDGPDGILDLDGLLDLVTGIAEAAFMATNHPEPQRLDRSSVAGQIFATLDARGFDGRASGHYSLSVGDTVTVGEVMLACASLGWERVAS